jgi:hypothetical protein
VYELAAKVQHDGPVDARTDAFVRERVALARRYGIVVLGVPATPRRRPLSRMRPGRRVDLRAPAPVARGARLHRDQAAAGVGAARALPRLPPLAQRLRERPDAAPADVEHAGDLLWYAELADAIAQVDGHRGRRRDRDPSGPTST